MTWPHFWFGFAIFVLLTLGIKFVFDPGWLISLGISFGIVSGVWLVANSDKVLDW